MDRVFHDWRARISQAFESRLPRLSRGARSSRFPREAWLLPVALILGLYANRGSREEGRLSWLRGNPPTVETWRALLNRRGFGAIEDPGWREKAFAEMPDVGRERAAALISEDRATFALRVESDWLYFGLGRSGGAGGATVKRELWEPLGIGWEAVARFDRLDLPTFRGVSPPKKTEWRDDRSLDY